MAGQKQLVRWVMLAAVIGGCAGLVSPALAQAQAVVAKQCDHCKRIVPITAQVGQNCPYCGVYWGAEQKEYVPGGDAGYPSSGYTPQPAPPAEWRSPWQLERERRRQMVRDLCEKQRQKDLAAQEKVYEWNREKTELAHEHENAAVRAERAERYVATADRYEKEGRLKQAAAMYRLAAGSAPDTAAAAKASEALTRLAAE